jgi:hypothetical protein
MRDGTSYIGCFKSPRAPVSFWFASLPNGPKRSDFASSDWRACLAAFTGAIEELPNEATIDICCLNKTAIEELLSIKASHDGGWRKSGSNRPKAAIEILQRLYEAIYGDTTNPRSIVVRAHTPSREDHSILDRLRRVLDGTEQ